MNELLRLCLTSSKERAKTVLWLRGTGINAWWYFGLLQKFTLEELAEFKSIVGVSGGAAVFWVNILSRLGHYDVETINDYDSIVRRVMNQAGAMTRLSRLLRLKSPYLASEHHDLLGNLVDREAFEWTFSQFPLKNFRVLTADEDDYRVFGDPRDDSLPLASIIAMGGTPRTGQDLDLKGVGDAISDFEYSSAHVRRKYKENLSLEHQDARKLVLNTRFESKHEGGEYTYVRLSPDGWPRLMLFADTLFLILNLPNGRYLEAFRWSMEDPLVLTE